MATRQALYYAAWFGDLKEVRKLVSEHGHDVMARDSDGHTPLHIAALSGREEAVRELVTMFKCPVNCVSSDGKKPLHVAAKWGRSSVVRLLLAELGADASLTDQNGDTSLDIATLNGHKNIISIIAEFLCNPIANFNFGTTSISLASEGGHLELLEKLVSERDCDLMARDSDGHTPIHIAALCGREELVRELVTGYKCPVNCVSSDERTDGHVNLIISVFRCSPHASLKHGRTPLHMACGRGHLDIIQNLVSEYGCDVMAMDSNGSTPLHVAAFSGREEVVRELVTQYRCPVDCVCSVYGETPLHKAAKEGHSNVVRLLLAELEADASITNQHGETAVALAALNGHINLIVSDFNSSLYSELICGHTPLHLACEGGHLDVVRKLVSEHGCDCVTRNNNGATPLHRAAGSGREEVVRELVTQYSCPVDCVSSDGKTPLHLAALGGRSSVVRLLLIELEADASLTDNYDNTVLHFAAFSGSYEVVHLLLTDFKCSPHVRNQYGRTSLHFACDGGHLDVVRKLVSEHGCDIMARDSDGRTPLHIAALSGKEDVVRHLVTQYSCPVDCVSSNGRTPLHLAAQGGHSSVVRLLLMELKVNASITDNDDYTALHFATFSGLDEVVDLLITEFGCSPHVTGQNGFTSLHYACHGGHLDVVRKLVSEHGCDIMARDNDGCTPLHIAALSGKEEVVRQLVAQYRCPVDCVSSKGCTPLQLAAGNGRSSIVKLLLAELGANAAKKGNTILHIAALNGHSKVVDLLITEFGCSPHVKGQYDCTSLHAACDGGHLDVVRKLVSEQGCDIMARDKDGCTPLHVAAWSGKEEVVRELVTQYRCPVDCVSSDGRTPLHEAAGNGYSSVVRLLICELNASTTIKDKASRTALFYAINSHNLEVVSELVRHNCDPSNLDAKYKQLSKLSGVKLSKGSFNKVFVLGDPQVGKSKGETWFQWDVKEVPPHTAGIIPVPHRSSFYGRVIFYDFAGDREYYSCHAAILEKLMGGSSNTFLLVFDLSKFDRRKLEEERILYWLTFLSYSSKVAMTKPRVVLVGSHADVLVSQGKDPDQLITEIFTVLSDTFYSRFPQTPLEMAGYAALDCCKTKSKGLQQIQNHLKHIQLSSLSGMKELSVGASILMGILERDGQVFNPACQLSSLVRHIKLNKLYLPSEPEQLHSYLKELDAYGLVLLLEGGPPLEEEWVVLHIDAILGTVQKRLFSSDNSKQNSGSLSNLGIIPDTMLQSLFPELSLSVLKSCMKLLQYCQEIDDTQIITKVLDVPPSPEITNSNSFLFFPALLQVERCNIKWVRSYSSLCCLGWYIECSKFRPYDFFPPRFLHVLLLRLAFTFALPKTSAESVDSISDVDVYSRRCTLWKNGIHWIGNSGIETVVEVVRQNRGVVVMVRGSSDMEVECVDVLDSVVRNVVEDKCEFCHALVARAFMVDPSNLKQECIPNADELQLFECSHIQDVLKTGSNGAVSENGRSFLPSSEICCLLSQTAWNLLFPLSLDNLLQCLNDIVREWFQLGVYLKVPPSNLEAIQCNNRDDVIRCKTVMLLEWLKRPNLKPSWCSLVDALQKLGSNRIVYDITQKFNIDLQSKLLDPTLESTPIKDDYLQQLSEAMGSRWSSFVPLLSLTSTETEQLKGEGQPSLAMLRSLREKKLLTYGGLRELLTAVPLLNPTV